MSTCRGKLVLIGSTGLPAVSSIVAEVSERKIFSLLVAKFSFILMMFNSGVGSTKVITGQSTDIV